VVVKTVRLHQVDNIEPVRLTCLCVADSEVVPLGVPPGVVVGLQDYVVFEFVHLDRSSQVAGFEPAFENQCVVVSILRYIERAYLAFYRLRRSRVRTGVNAVVNHSVH